MIEIKTFKVKIVNPDSYTRDYFFNCLGQNDYVYNYGVKSFYDIEQQRLTNKEIKQKSWQDLQKELNNEAHQDFFAEINSMVRTTALKRFDQARKNYFEKLKSGDVAKRQQEIFNKTGKMLYNLFKPKYKTKNNRSKSFEMFLKGGSEFKIESPHYLSIVTTRNKPRLYLQLAESIAFIYRAQTDKKEAIRSVRISYEGGEFWISITYQQPVNVKTPSKNKIGIDLGIKHALTCFTGSAAYQLDVPENLLEAEHKRQRIQTKYSRAEKGSRNHKKLRLQLQRAHMRENEIKRDFREKTTTSLVKTFGQINIDDFNFKGALGLKRARRKLHRVGLYEFKTRLEEKAKLYQTTLNYMPPFTPTTQTCSSCGNRQKLKLSDRIYICPCCGFVEDRDINAAINVFNFI